MRFEKASSDSAILPSRLPIGTGRPGRTTVSSTESEQLGTIPTRRIGTLAWDYARDIEEEPEKWRLHLANLDAHKPFRDFRYRAASRDGSELHLASSGKPLFDPQGRFLGYRG